MAYQLTTAKIWDGAAWVNAVTPYLDVDLLAVGGGAGAGGWDNSTDGRVSGGGGAGGFFEGTVNVPLGVPFRLVVGAGGAGGADEDTLGANGSDSAFHTLICPGGGGGGCGTDNNGFDSRRNGRSGATGGGAGGKVGRGEQAKGYDVDLLSIDFGYQGSNSNITGTNNDCNGGGGGGAGDRASTPTDSTGGHGGIGRTTTLITATQATTYSVGEVSGSDVYFSGGGGGGTCNDEGGLGGLGGGGDYGWKATIAENGAINTGGGGGGSGDTGGTGAGASGGSGVIIFSIPSEYTATFSAGVTTPSSFTSGSNTVYIVKATSTEEETVTIS